MAKKNLLTWHIVVYRDTTSNRDRRGEHGSKYVQHDIAREDLKHPIAEEMRIPDHQEVDLAIVKNRLIEETS